MSLLDFKTHSYRNQDCGVGRSIDTWVNKNRIQNPEIGLHRYAPLIEQRLKAVQWRNNILSILFPETIGKTIHPQPKCNILKKTESKCFLNFNVKKLVGKKKSLKF